MATGDAADITLRLQRWLPSRWFPPGAGTRVWATISGFSAAFATNYRQVAYSAAQTRIATSTDAFLDLLAADYLGTFPRRLNEIDVAYAARIQKEVTRPRNTRAAIIEVLQDLTGNIPAVINPASPSDCGGWDTGYLAWDKLGCWGDTNLPFQSLISIRRGTAAGAGVNVTFPYPAGGWDSIGGYDTGSSAWVDNTPAQNGVTDDDIYTAVASVMPEGHMLWTRILTV